MLSDKEKEGCRKILEGLSTESLYSLSDTVTKRQIAVCNRNEAINAIIQYTIRSVELLRRRKISRDSLFQYLVSANVKIEVNIDKSQLIRRTVEFWGNAEDAANLRENDLIEEDDGEESSSSTFSLTSRTSASAVSNSPKGFTNRKKTPLNSSRTSLGNSSGPSTSANVNGSVSRSDTPSTSFHNPGAPTQPTIQINISPFTNTHSVNVNANSSGVSANIQVNTPLTPTGPTTSMYGNSTDASSSFNSPNRVTSFEASRQNVPVSAVNAGVVAPTLAASNSAAVPEIPPLEPRHVELARAFTVWFFQVLNSQNPDFGSNSGEFGPQHFYEDARLSVRTQEPGNNRTDGFQGAHNVYTKLLTFVINEKLLFNPNVDDNDIKVKMEPHGMVMVGCCGTIHKVGQWVGVFEQATIIIRDPVMENNWKVKEIRLSLKANESSGAPHVQAPQQMPAIQ